MIAKTGLIIPAAIVTTIGLANVLGCTGYFHKLCQKGEFKMHEEIKKKIIKELDLNEDQQAKLDAIHGEIKSQWRFHENSHRQMFETFKSEIRKDTLDQDVLQQMMAQKHERINEVKPLVMEKIVAFHASLTPEQKEKLISRMDKFHEKKKCCHFH